MFETVNLIEGILWICIGGCFGVSLVRSELRGAKSMAAFTFIVFGISDFVQIQSGAWWKPWWLLLWKAACVGMMFVLIVYYYKSRGRSEVS